MNISEIGKQVMKDHIPQNQNNFNVNSLLFTKKPDISQHRKKSHAFNLYNENFKKKMLCDLTKKIQLDGIFANNKNLLGNNLKQYLIEQKIEVNYVIKMEKTVFDKLKNISNIIGLK